MPRQVPCSETRYSSPGSQATHSKGRYLRNVPQTKDRSIRRQWHCIRAISRYRLTIHEFTALRTTRLPEPQTRRYRRSIHEKQGRYRLAIHSTPT